MPEIALIVNSLKRNPMGSRNKTMNLIIFRLATNAGLRASEIANLRMRDVVVGTANGGSGTATGVIARPCLHILNSKNGKSRIVPLNWCGLTLADLTAFKQLRESEGATDICPFLTTANGKALHRNGVRNRYITACKPIGRNVTTHMGRHSFISHALDRGKALAEVRDAAGHSSIAVTNQYVHIVSDDATIGNLFPV